MTYVTETFQQCFAAQIANLVIQAYNSGVLQWHPMTIAGITVEMTMFRNFNQLAVRFEQKLMSISLYPEDSDEATESSIQNLLADIIA